MTEERKNCCQAMHGWQVKKTYDISMPKANVVELEHVKTGAKYLHLATDSKENVFAVTFKTVPNSSNGVAHILEHTVLTGSRKYPLRDPFFSMIKRSLQTFMNAMTSSDWTAYPFASPNKKDFYNLLSVYLDAVFFPQLKHLNFLQEGWRYDFGKGKLNYRGVVYNEMKGSMSSPARCMEEAIMKSLYTEAPYHYNTGGDPATIPNLSYADLLAFHKKFYQPSNAYFYSYGNLPLADNLCFINKNVLDSFDKAKTKISIMPEKRWSKPKTHKHCYAVGKNEDDRGRHQTALAWLGPLSKNNLEVFSLEILEDIFIGSQASPLRKALLDSRLGTDLCDACGYDSEMFDTSFVLGLKGVKKENTKKIKQLIFSCLEDLYKKGIDSELIEGVLNSNEIRKKNISNQPYPYGLQIFFSIIGPWMHSAKVSEILDFDKLLMELRVRIKKGRYFEELIKKYFLTNTHYSLLFLSPDEGRQDQLDKKEERKLSKIAMSLSEKDKEAIKKDSNALIAWQDLSDDLSCLPTLELDDIDEQIEKTTASTKSESGISIYTKNTNNLVYFLAGFSLTSLDDSLKKLLPFFTFLLPRLNTKKTDYQTLAKRIDNLTGGIGLSAQALNYHGVEYEDVEIMNVQAFALKKNSKAMVELLEEIIGDYDFSDEERIAKLLDVFLSKYQSQIIDQGHTFAALRALSPLSLANQTAEAWQGLEQLNFLQKLKKKNRENNFALLEKLGLIGEYINKKAKSDIALVVEPDDSLEIKKEVRKLIRRGKRKKIIFSKENNLKEAWQVASAVSFSAAGMKVPDISHKDSPALLLATKILSQSFLHNEIREKGGAYGGFARYNHNEGNLYFGSYRDPQIKRTLEIFGKSKNFLLSGNYSAQDIKEAIIALSSAIESPLTEIEQAQKAFGRKLTALSDKSRQLFREKLLMVKKEDIIRVASKYLRDDWEDYSVVVLAETKDLQKNGLIKAEKWSLNRIF